MLRAADLRFTRGNAIELFDDGRGGLEAMRSAIEDARSRIHLETYIFRGDDTGRRFIEAMAERARAGVEVRLLYDAFGSLGLDPRVLEPLRAAGGDVVAFNPLRRLYPRWAPRRRDHRKILVVDGRVGFVGGLNVGDEYFYGPQPAEPRARWRDAHVRIVGPAVAMLEAVFLESWFRADGPDRPWIGASEASPREGGEAVAVLADGPTYHRRRVRDLLIDALGRVHDEVRLATPYFIPGARLRAALAAAAERGVRVELLLAGYTDHPVLRWAAHARLPPLLTRGVRVFEYGTSMMHAKVAVFDAHWALLGTSNLERQSLEHSYEVNLLVAGSGLPLSLSRMLEEDMRRSKEVTLEDLAARSPWRRLRDRLAALFLTRL